MRFSALIISTLQRTATDQSGKKSDICKATTVTRDIIALRPLVLFITATAIAGASYLTYDLVIDDSETNEPQTHQDSTLPDDLRRESFLLINEANASPLVEEPNDKEAAEIDWKNISISIAKHRQEDKKNSYPVTLDPALPKTEKEQEEIIDQIMKDAHKKAPQKAEPKEKPMFKKSQASKDVCIKLKAINIDEKDLFPEDKQKDITDKYLNQCLESKLIKGLLAEISGFYLEEGYVTTKAFLTPQDISDGEIEVKIIKGMVEKIFFTGESESRWKVKTAFAFQEGKVLNIRDLENALENVNRLPSNNAKLNLLPGSKHGQTKVAIDNEKSSPLRVTLGVTGEENLEDENPDLTLTLHYDNLFNINDMLGITVNGSKIQEEYQGTRGFEVNYSFPIGSFLYELIYSETSYRQEVVGINDNYLSEGETIGRKLRINKKLFRDQTNKYEAKASINHKDTKNYFEKELVEVSSYKTTVFQLDMIHTWLFSSGQLLSTLSYHRGVDWFDSVSDDDFNEEETDYEDAPKFEFIKYTFDTNLIYYITRSNSPWMFGSNFRYQYSEDVLHSSEQLSVGNYYSVRGYTNRYLSGNNGWYLKNDLKKTISLGVSERLLSSLTIYIGRDVGEIFCERTTEETCGTLEGMAVGFNTLGKNFSSDFTWAKPLRAIGDDFDDSEVFKYTLQAMF